MLLRYTAVIYSKVIQFVARQLLLYNNSSNSSRTRMAFTSSALCVLVFFVLFCAYLGSFFIFFITAAVAQHLCDHGIYSVDVESKTDCSSNNVYCENTLLSHIG